MIVRSFVVAGLLSTLMCSAQAPPLSASEDVLVFEQARNDWFQGDYAPVALSPDASWALFGRGEHLFSLSTGHEESSKLTAGLDSLDDATFCGSDATALARLGHRGNEHGWFLPETESDQVSDIPADAILACSSDQSKIAYLERGARDHALHVGPRGRYRTYSLTGSVTAMAFSADDELLYCLALDTNGQATFSRISVSTGETKVIASQLDGSAHGGQIALSSDGKSAYMALASSKAPDDTMRHQPHADRWLKIYKMDLVTGTLQSVVDTPGCDNTGPAIANGNLYWTRSVIHDSIVTLPSHGGLAKELIAGGQLPLWHPSGTKIAYFFGDSRLADMPLDLDDAVVDVDAKGSRTSEPSIIVSGYHEDFSPNWSPDGKWIAFHSHRSPTPVPQYRSPGSSDDIYLRRADDLHAPEIRLTNFGLETGPAYWSPDGQKLLMMSEQRGGTQGISKLWVLTMDTRKGAVLKTEMLPLSQKIRSATWAIWSPDGKKIAIEDKRGTGKQTIWVVRSDGSHPQKVVDYEGGTYQGLDWSRNGKSIVYSALAGDQLQLFSISCAGGTPKQLTYDSANLMHPRFSPNGRFVASTREAQTKQIWRRPLP